MKKLYTITIVVLVLVTICVWYFLDTLHNPQKEALSEQTKKQALEKLLNRDPVLQDKHPAGWKTFDGKYIHFSYPSDANVYKPAVQPATVLESFSCGLISSHILIAIQVIQPGELNSIGGYPGVSLRQTEKDIYHGNNAIVASHQGLAFTKEGVDGVEKSAFFLLDGRVFSLVVSGYQQQEVEQYYKRVLASTSF